MLTPWDDLFHSMRLFHLCVFRRSQFCFGQTCIFNTSGRDIKKQAFPPCFLRSWPLVIKNASLAENKTATYGKRNGALERSQRVEQTIPTGQSPTSPLVGRTAVKKGQKCTFQQDLFFDTVHKKWPNGSNTV